MKNHRFPWLRNRTTDNRKCEKARNIKEKRTIEMFSTVSKQLVELRSSPNVKQALIGYNNIRSRRRKALHGLPGHCSGRLLYFITALTSKNNY